MQPRDVQGTSSVRGGETRAHDFGARVMPGAPTTPPLMAANVKAIAPNSTTSEGECTPLDAVDPCHFVRHSGSCAYNKLDYLAFHYCTVRAEHHLPEWASLLVLGPWVMFLSCGIVQVSPDASVLLNTEQFDVLGPVILGSQALLSGVQVQVSMRLGINEYNQLILLEFQEGTFAWAFRKAPLV